ncbi:tRNA adenosine deaminase-associated protein [Brevibacterium ihuae]|uniref:tRNA adenosine deaminase-associated protein n=1 Tax=Brevibacterium ihuae TaxID=1631743 RepID=UPI000C76FA41|nr:tRNA adenosine deaminase-associated protein [Brevibacterium ihuae]
MAYFTAVLSHSSGGYRAVDYDIRDAANLDDLLETMRSGGEDEGEAVAVIEHEDEWFALVRLSAADEVKVFLSDVHAVAESPFAELFVDYLDARQDEYESDEDIEEESAAPVADEDAEVDDEEDDEVVPMLDLEDDAEWGGDADVFADLGVPAEELLEQAQTHASDPARVVAHVGEAVGFADQLEAAR